MEKVRYTISDAAQMMDVESHALRYWEEELDLSVPRNEQGHRYYTKENIEQFQKIKDLKEKGYQLKAIKMLLHEEEPLLETEPQPKEKADRKSTRLNSSHANESRMAAAIHQICKHGKTVEKDERCRCRRKTACICFFVSYFHDEKFL